MRKIKPKVEKEKVKMQQAPRVVEKKQEQIQNLFEKLVMRKLDIYAQELGDIPQKLKTKKLIKRKNEIINEASVIKNENIVQEVFFDINSRLLGFVQDVDDFFEFKAEHTALFEYYKEKSKSHLAETRKKDYINKSQFTPIELRNKYLKTLEHGDTIKKEIININDLKNTRLLLSIVSKKITATHNKIPEKDMIPIYRFYITDDIYNLVLYLEPELEIINQLLPEANFSKDLKITFQKWYKEMVNLKKYLASYVKDRNENSKEALALTYTKLMDEYKIKTNQTVLPIRDEHRNTFVLGFIDRNTDKEIKRRIRHIKTELTKLDKKQAIIREYMNYAREKLSSINTEEEFNDYGLYLKTLKEKELKKELEEVKELY